MKCVCIECGTIKKSTNGTGYCENNHDNWLEPVDIMNVDQTKVIEPTDQGGFGGDEKDCLTWVNQCISNTGMSLEDIWDKMKGGICI